VNNFIKYINSHYSTDEDNIHRISDTMYSTMLL